MNTTKKLLLKQPDMTKDLIDDAVGAIGFNAGVVEGLLGGMTDMTIAQGQAVGGTLLGFIQTQQGFIFEWGRVSVPNGAGMRITFSVPNSVTIGIFTNCTTGMYMTYSPKTSWDGKGFNVVQSSSVEQEVCWYSIGRS